MAFTYVEESGWFPVCVNPDPPVEPLCRPNDSKVGSVYVLGPVTPRLAMKYFWKAKTLRLRLEGISYRRQHDKYSHQNVGASAPTVSIPAVEFMLPSLTDDPEDPSGYVLTQKMGQRICAPHSVLFQNPDSSQRQSFTVFGTQVIDADGASPGQPSSISDTVSFSAPTIQLFGLYPLVYGCDDPSFKFAEVSLNGQLTDPDKETLHIPLSFFVLVDSESNESHFDGCEFAIQNVYCPSGFGQGGDCSPCDPNLLSLCCPYDGPNPPPPPRPPECSSGYFGQACHPAVTVGSANFRFSDWPAGKTVPLDISITFGYALGCSGDRNTYEVSISKVELSVVEELSTD